MTHSMQDLQKLEISQGTNDEYVFKGSRIQTSDQVQSNLNSAGKKISITVESPDPVDRKSPQNKRIQSEKKFEIIDEQPLKMDPQNQTIENLKNKRLESPKQKQNESPEPTEKKRSRRQSPSQYLVQSSSTRNQKVVKEENADIKGYIKSERITQAVDKKNKPNGVAKNQKCKGALKTFIGESSNLNEPRKVDQDFQNGAKFVKIEESVRKLGLTGGEIRNNEVSHSRREETSTTDIGVGNSHAFLNPVGYTQILKNSFTADTVSLLASHRRNPTNLLLKDSKSVSINGHTSGSFVSGSLLKGSTKNRRKKDSQKEQEHSRTTNLGKDDKFADCSMLVQSINPQTKYESVLKNLPNSPFKTQIKLPSMNYSPSSTKKSLESANNLPYLKGHISPANRNIHHDSVKSTARIDTAFAVSTAINDLESKNQISSPKKVTYNDLKTMAEIYSKNVSSSPVKVQIFDIPTQELPPNFIQNNGMSPKNREKNIDSNRNQNIQGNRSTRHQSKFEISSLNSKNKLQTSNNSMLTQKIQKQKAALTKVENAHIKATQIISKVQKDSFVQDVLDVNLENAQNNYPTQNQNPTEINSSDQIMHQQSNLAQNLNQVSVPFERQLNFEDQNYLSKTTHGFKRIDIHQNQEGQIEEKVIVEKTTLNQATSFEGRKSLNSLNTTNQQINTLLNMTHSHGHIVSNNNNYNAAPQQNSEDLTQGASTNRMNQQQQIQEITLDSCSADESKRGKRDRGLVTEFFDPLQQDEQIVPPISVQRRDFYSGLAALHQSRDSTLMSNYRKTFTSRDAKENFKKVSKPETQTTTAAFDKNKAPQIHEFLDKMNQKTKRRSNHPIRGQVSMSVQMMQKQRRWDIISSEASQNNRKVDQRQKKQTYESKEDTVKKRDRYKNQMLISEIASRNQKDAPHNTTIYSQNSFQLFSHMPPRKLQSDLQIQIQPSTVQAPLRPFRLSYASPKIFDEVKFTKRKPTQIDHSKRESQIKRGALKFTGQYEQEYMNLLTQIKGTQADFRDEDLVIMVNDEPKDEGGAPSQRNESRLINPSPLDHAMPGFNDQEHQSPSLMQLGQSNNSFGQKFRGKQHREVNQNRTGGESKFGHKKQLSQLKKVSVTDPFFVRSSHTSPHTTRFNTNLSRVSKKVYSQLRQSNELSGSRMAQNLGKVLQKSTTFEKANMSEECLPQNLQIQQNQPTQVSEISQPSNLVQRLEGPLNSAYTKTNGTNLIDELQTGANLIKRQDNRNVDSTFQMTSNSAINFQQKLNRANRRIELEGALGNKTYQNEQQEEQILDVTNSHILFPVLNQISRKTQDGTRFQKYNQSSSKGQYQTSRRNLV